MEQEIEKDLILKFQMFEQQIIAIQQQLEAIEQALIEISSLNLGLNEIKKDREILAPIGRGIFVNAKILSENLTVDIGGKNYIQKSIPQTKKLIDEQIKKLENVKDGLNKKLEEINGELTKEIINSQSKENKDHKYDDKKCKHKH